MYEEEIKKLLTSKKLIVGKEEVLKAIRNNKLLKVYYASNCPKDLVTDIQRYNSMSSFEVFETNIPNDDLGTLCKKPFSIAVLGVMK